VSLRGGGEADGATRRLTAAGPGRKSVEGLRFTQVGGSPHSGGARVDIDGAVGTELARSGPGSERFPLRGAWAGRTEHGDGDSPKGEEGGRRCRPLRGALVSPPTSSWQQRENYEK
jgi:hypothetical protein